MRKTLFQTILLLKPYSKLLSKEFLSQFQTEEDVSNFLKSLHTQVLEQLLQGEMDAHLGYQKYSSKGFDNNLSSINKT